MSIFNELKRRNVIRIAGIYAVVAWILMQVAGTLEESLKLPEWFDSVVTAGLMIGFPIALLLAWAFEMTPVTYMMWGKDFPKYGKSKYFKQQIIGSGVYNYWQEVGYPPQCRPVGEDDFECD